jgi:quinol monooxygenase YgiN
MELYIFARFHARAGEENAVEQAIREVAHPTRAEPGCLNYHVFRSTRDPRLFIIHSEFRDEEAFELHAALPHTVRFIERVEQLIDHPLDVMRSSLLL